MLYRVIDTETTGRDATGEVIELGVTDAWRSPGSDTLSINPPQGFLFDAAKGVPAETRAVHHISAAEIAGKPLFDPALARDLPSTFHGTTPSFFVAHNCSFEQIFIPELSTRPVPWICTFKVARRLFPEMPAHNNFTLFYTFLEQGLISPNLELCGQAHRAPADSYATAHNLAVLLMRASTEQMLQWTLEPPLLTILNFGKHKGQNINEVPFDYLQWIAFRSDMDEDTKWNARREMDRRNRR